MAVQIESPRGTTTKVRNLSPKRLRSAFIRAQTVLSGGLELSETSDSRRTPLACELISSCAKALFQFQRSRLAGLDHRTTSVSPSAAAAKPEKSLTSINGDSSLAGATIDCSRRPRATSS